MSYDLHITRKKLYVDDEGPDITWDEWKSYVATDPELRLAPELGKHMVAINIKCGYPDPWLEWYEGNIETKNPDEPILAKMLQIAAALKGKVQGDDGEVYRSANFSITMMKSSGIRCPKCGSGQASREGREGGGRISG